MDQIEALRPPTLDDIKKQLDTMRVELQRQNERDRAEIKRLFACIKDRNAQMAQFPREPIKRTKKTK